MKSFKQVFINSVWMVVIFASEVNVAAESELQMGVGLMAFDYVEYDDNNIFLDGESGIIPGIILKLNTDKGKSYSEWVNSLYYNKIEYDGQTQSGIPLITVSDALIIDSHLKLGKRFNSAYGREQSIYVGLGYRYWFRNIIPGRDINGNAVAGILEEYHWFYGLLGYAVHFNAAKKVNVGLDFRLTQMFNAKMDIDFLGFKSYDNTSVNLGNKIGARFAMPIEIKMSKDSFFITPYYEIIDIGKGDSVRVYSGGAATTSIIYEPRSETRNVGIELIWSW